jgi:hypothetical protein
MTSWAGIAKRNIPSSASKPVHAEPAPAKPAPAKPAPATARQGIQVNPDLYAAASIAESCDTHDKLAVAALEREEQSQCRPTWLGLRRPDAPTVSPIFRTREEQLKWMHDEAIKNDAYSDEVFERRMQEWRTKKNWLLPPMKTEVSKEEQLRGFYVSKELDTAGKPVVKYVTPYSTERDVEHGSMVNMMWCLVHSRADELVACKTVADFNALFEQTIRLEYPSYPSFSLQYHLKRIVTPRKLLWMFSQKANMFPGKARPGTARWTVDPTNLYPAPVFDPKVYTKSMVFFNLRDCRGATISTDEREVRTMKPVYIVGASGGRDETGICVVERLVQFGDQAKIRWLLSAQQLRKMERVVFVSDCCPFRQFIDSDDDYDYC